MGMSVSQIMPMIMLMIFMSMRMITRTGGPLLLPIHPHIHFGRRNPAAIDLRDAQSRTELQRSHSSLQQVRRHARIDQGAQKHVAAHAGKTIKVGNAHGKTVARRQSLVFSQAHAACGVVDTLQCLEISRERPLCAQTRRPWDSLTTGD